MIQIAKEISKVKTTHLKLPGHFHLKKTHNPLDGVQYEITIEDWNHLEGAVRSFNHLKENDRLKLMDYGGTLKMLSKVNNLIKTI